MSVEHSKDCTWERHVAAGEVPPGQTFWGKLDWIWCQANCKWPETERDPACVARKIGSGNAVDVLSVLQSYQSPKDGSINIPPFCDETPVSQPRKSWWKRLWTKN